MSVRAFDDDRSAIMAAGDFVSAEFPSVAVARGSGEPPELLGAWEFENDQALWWSEA